MSVAGRTETMPPFGGAEAAMKAHRDVAERFGVALEQTQEALSQVQQVAVEEIRIGLQASHHVEAAERELRGALRSSFWLSAGYEPDRSCLLVSIGGPS